MDENPLAQPVDLVIKVGSALLVDAKTGALRRRWLDGLAKDIAERQRGGDTVMVVSSGSVALGRAILGLPNDAPLALHDAQAAAAVGQIDLARWWRIHLARYGIKTALALLTMADTEDRARYLNARAALAALARRGVIPVINENDTITTAELRYGDNDRLAARVSAMTGARRLVLLSSVDGLYDTPPGKDGKGGGNFIPHIHAITPEIVAMAGDAVDNFASGGMKTKIAAARIAMAAGCDMVIADGRGVRPLRTIARGGRCSWFHAHAAPGSARKRWIVGALDLAGTLRVDDGCARALARGASLLPAGVIGLEGAFNKGDALRVLSASGHEIARGLVNYPATEAARIIGRRSNAIAAALGYNGPPELIHRDHLALLEPTA